MGYACRCVRRVVGASTSGCQRQAAKFREKLDAEIKDKMAKSESAIEAAQPRLSPDPRCGNLTVQERKKDFVKQSLAAIGL
eukprot:Skav210729  [mRNA]  locus=scaffold849:380390:380833:- [translate_table: standard]